MSIFTGGKLYRYFPYYRDYKEYVREVITDNKLYFSSPKQFNDPFDCKIEGLKFDRDSIIDFYRNRYANQVPKELLDKLVIDNFDKITTYCNSVIIELQNLVNEQFSVLCMTTSNDNIMMYSHYADKHKGVCLEFELLQDNILMPEEVIYVEEFPNPIFSEEIENLRQLAVALITTKASMWSYEKEYRCLKPAFGHLVYPPEYLTGIIFGCKTEQTTKEDIYEMARLSLKQLDFYQAKASKTTFSLDIEKLN